MSTRYIATKRTVLHPNSQTNSQDLVLIFGDEVETTGQHANGRDEVVSRRRLGWVRTGRLSPNHPLEMYFIDVGQGDSSFIVTPNGKRILIDGGIGNEAFQFLVWKYRLDLPNPEPVNIDLMVVSHADDDHLAGLISIVAHPLINVRQIIHSGIAKYNSGFGTRLGDTVGQGKNRLLVTRHNEVDDLAGVDLSSTMKRWRNAVRNEPGLIYRAVDSRVKSIDIGDSAISLNVLGPRLVNQPSNGGLAYPWLGNPAKTVNGHSVVLRLDFHNIRVLLTGDVNDRGARHLMSDPEFAAEADAHVLKVPHHGSHEFDRRFLEAVHPQISIVSSGEAPDHGHPRADLLATIGNVSRSDQPILFSTELVALFAVDADAAASDADDDVDPDATDPAMLGQARRRFKKRLNGIINVRSDGNDIYCARRVAAGYQFVTYKLPAAPRNPA